MARFRHCSGKILIVSATPRNWKDFFILFNSSEKKIVTHVLSPVGNAITAFKIKAIVLICYLGSCITHPKCRVECDSFLRSSSHSMNWKPAVNDKLPSRVIFEVLYTTFLRNARLHNNTNKTCLRTTHRGCLWRMSQGEREDLPLFILNQKQKINLGFQQLILLIHAYELRLTFHLPHN